MVKKTIFDQLELSRSGTIQLRLLKCFYDEHGKVIGHPELMYHRTVLEPGADLDAQMAVVNAHLEQLGEARVEDAELAQVRAVVQAVHTPAAVTRYRMERAALLQLASDS